MKQTRTRKRQERTAKQPGRRWRMDHYSSSVLVFYSGSSGSEGVLSGSFPRQRRQGWRGQQRSTGGHNLGAPVVREKLAGTPLSQGQMLQSALPLGDAKSHKDTRTHVSWTLGRLVPGALSIDCAPVPAVLPDSRLLCCCTRYVRILCNGRPCRGMLFVLFARNGIWKEPRKRHKRRRHTLVRGEEALGAGTGSVGARGPERQRLL